MKHKFKQIIDYLKNTDIEISIRLFYIAAYALLIASILGTVTMLIVTTSIVLLIPNVILLVFIIAGLYMSYFKKKYEIASNLIIIGCGFISLPFMFFTAGGNNSGMIIWFLFGVMFSCVLSTGKSRFVMPTIMITISALNMLIGYLYPDIVISLKSDKAEFFDTFQSFLIVSIMIVVTLRVYFTTYESQRKKLEKQSQELHQMAYTDTLTGIANRQAYYKSINQYKENEALKEDTTQSNLVVAAMDVNGLKRVNDTEGHAAGDDLIKCAADCIQKAFGKYGNVFRTGGDEFMAIIFCDDSKIDGLHEALRRSIQESEDKRAEGMTIALGIASIKRESKKDFLELEKLADERMYEDKNAHYNNTSAERRK